MQKFHIRNLKTSDSEYFTADTLEAAVDAASLHFFGELPANYSIDQNERIELLQNDGRITGRLVVIGNPVTIESPVFTADSNWGTWVPVGETTNPDGFYHVPLAGCSHPPLAAPLNGDSVVAGTAVYLADQLGDDIMQAVVWYQVANSEAVYIGTWALEPAFLMAGYGQAGDRSVEAEPDLQAWLKECRVAIANALIDMELPPEPKNIAAQDLRAAVSQLVLEVISSDANGFANAVAEAHILMGYEGDVDGSEQFYSANARLMAFITGAE